MLLPVISFHKATLLWAVTQTLQINMAIKPILANIFSLIASELLMVGILSISVW